MLITMKWKYYHELCFCVLCGCAWSFQKAG